MSKREKIIVGLMVVAILYGGYNFLFSGSAGIKNKFSRQPQVALNEFVADLAKRIQAADSLAADRLVLEKASAAWRKDAFLVIEEMTEPEKEAAKEPEIIEREDLTGVFNYSGYMEMGKSKLAIIDGLEYQEGDHLAAQGAAVKRITPGEVHIYVDAEKGIIIVPIDDTAKQ